MATCGNCGTEAVKDAPCPACGVLVEEELILDLAEPIVHEQGQQQEVPSAAQFGGAAEPLASAEQPVANEIQIEPRSFYERERGTMQWAWRLSKVPVLLILGWFTASHVLFDAQWVFVDNVNLLFHEAGHFLFGWDGMTLAALGGTLGQLLLPASAAVYFLWWRKEYFAGATCGWWVAENFMGIGRYMNDAPVEELPLIGGSVHDWAYLFGKWDLISHARDIGGFFRLLGYVGMIGTLALLIYWTVRPSREQLESG